MNNMSDSFRLVSDRAPSCCNVFTIPPNIRHHIDNTVRQSLLWYAGLLAIVLSAGLIEPYNRLGNHYH